MTYHGRRKLSTFLAALLTGTALSSVAVTADPVGSFDGADLSLSRWAGDPWTAGQVAAANGWNEKTGGNLVVEAIPYQNLRDKQVLEMANGTYDIMYVHPGWFGEYAGAGALLQIDNYLDDPAMNPDGFGRDAYIPSVLAQGAHDGKQYCVQDFVASIIVAYRQDLYDAAGLDAPATLNDVLADAAVLNTDGVAGITLPGKATGATADVISTLITANGTWWYDSDGKPALDVDAATNAVQFYVDAAQMAPDGVLNYHFDEVVTAAAQGKAAIAITSTPSLAWLGDPERSSTVGKWSFAPVAVEADNPSGELIFWNWCINAASKNPEAAYSFLQYWTSGAQQGAVARDTNTAGATHDFYQDAALLQDMPFLGALQSALKNANAQPSIAEWPRLQDGIEKAVQGAIEGSLTAQEAAQEMADLLDRVLG